MARGDKANRAGGSRKDRPINRDRVRLLTVRESGQRSAVDGNPPKSLAESVAEKVEQIRREWEWN